MADNYIITISYSFDAGSVEGEASAAGKKAGDAFGNSFKPQFDWVNKVTQALNPDEVGKKAVSGISNAFKNLNLSLEIEKSLSNVDFAKTNFGKGLENTITRATQRASAATTEIIPPKPSAGVTGEGANLTARIQPFLSGLEAFSMMMRGAPFLSVAQMAGQAITGFQSQRASAAIEPGRIYFPGGRPGETENLAISRRLGAAPGAAVAETGVVESAAVGGAAGLLTGAIKPITAALGAGAAIAFAAHKTRDAIAELGEQETKQVVNQKLLAGVMGLSERGLLELQHRFEKAGAPVGELDHAFFRLAVRANRAMPEIAREVEDSANVQEMSLIKIRDSERALAKSRDDRQAATERVSKSEGELRKVQETGADVREQERRAAELGVTGAAIAQRGAQMRVAQAGIALQFAPQEAQFADIRGAQTVEGARLGRRGAGIQYEEALAKFRAQRYGEEEDPDVVELRQRRKEDLALATARHNRDQADLREREAISAEEKRQTQVAAGVGPEAQAQQQALEAAQAKEMADLHVQRAVTFKQQLAITQETNTRDMEINEAKRAYAESIRQVPAAADAESKARIENETAIKEEARLRYKQIPAVQQALRGEQPAGFDIRQIEPTTLAKALFAEGEGRPAAIAEAMTKFFETPQFKALPETEQVQQQIKTITSAFQQRSLADLPALIQAITKEPSEPSPEAKKAIEDILATRKAAEPLVPKVEEAVGEKALQERAAREATALKALPFTPDIIKKQAEETAEQERLKQLGLRGLGGAGSVIDFLFPKPEEVLRRLTEPKSVLAPSPGDVQKRIGAREAERQPPVIDTSAITGAGEKVGAGITSAGGEVEGALRGVASKIQSITIPSPQSKPEAGSTSGPATATEAGTPLQESAFQGGGLLHGPGTGTSDDIPINASAGEYVVRASEVGKPGVLPMLESINAGRHPFQGGGLVTAGGTPAANLTGLNDYERWIYNHGVVPDKQDWDDAKAAGLDPNTSFDKDGKLIASAAALVKAKRGVTPSKAATAPAAALGPPIVAGPGVGIGQGLRFAPGEQPQAQLSDKDFQQALKDRGYTIPPGSVVIRNPFFPDQSAQIRLPNRGPMILVPPPSPPTTGARPPAAPPGIPPVPGTRFQYPRGGPMVVYPPSVIGPVFPGTGGDPSLPKTISPQESEELKKRRDERLAEAQKQFDEEKRSKERIATDQKAIAEAQDPNSPNYLEKLNKLGDAFGQAGDIIERSHELKPYEEIPIPRPRMRPDDLLDAIKKLIPDELKEKPAKPSMDELRKRLIEPGNPVVDPQFRGDVGDVGRQFAAIKPADLLDTVPETGPGSLPTEPPQYIPTEPEGGPGEIPTRRWDWNFDRPSDQTIDLAQGGLVGNFLRRHFANGGVVGEDIAGAFAKARTLGEEDPRSGFITKRALADLSARLSRGVGAEVFASSMATVPGSTGPGPFVANPSAGAGLSALGYYQLDMRTSAGVFPAAVSENVMEGIRQSSLGGKISSTGTRPSWFS